VTLSVKLVIDGRSKGDVDALEAAKDHIREMIVRRVYGQPSDEIYKALSEFMLEHCPVDFKSATLAKERLVKAIREAGHPSRPERPMPAV